MKDFLLDENGDKYFDGRDFALAEGSQALAQSLQIHFLTIKGEWVYNQKIGVEYWEVIFEQGVSYSIKYQTLRNVISSHPKIRSVDEFKLEIDYENRALAAEFQATSVDDVALTGTLTGPGV